MASTEPTAPYYTQSELARLAGLSRSAVNKAIERGLLTTEVTAGGDVPLVPKAEGDRWLKGRKTTRGPDAAKGR